MRDLNQQFAAVQSAPELYFGALIAVALAIWAVIHFLYKRRLESLKEDVAKEERENRRLKQKLDEVALLAIPSRATHKRPAPTPASSRERVRVDDARDRVMVPDEVTAATLRALCADKTAVEAARLVAPYLGKWMRVTGVVKEVQNDNTLGWNVSVDDDPGAFLAISILYLVDGQEAKAEMLRRDVRVSAIGCVTKVDKYVVTFESCVLE